MTLSTSRQQFLAYETQGTEDIHYGRKNGIFISTCVCISLIILAVLAAILVGIIVYFITYFKLSQKSGDFWDETEPFGQTGPPSPDLRLPPHVVPSFYRLKLKADLDNSSFSGDVYITIRANKKVKEIILHSKDLSINSNAKLTEQIYEKMETIIYTPKVKREVNSVENGTIDRNVTVTSTSITEVPKLETSTTHENVTEIVTDPPYSPTDTQVTHSTVRNIKIISITAGAGDRLILTLASALRPGVDYTLELSFAGKILNSLTGFYKSSYKNSNNEIRHLGVTQFEPTSARAAFPCFDEPAFKAKFEISIAHPQNISVLSNMKVAAQEDNNEQPGWKWTHFERSVNMSTYLVAYILSDFQSLETNYTSKDNITKIIKVWTRPELISKAKYALKITPKLLKYYEDVFGVAYALDKIDLIAIPDFSSGAMENWGLITFRETTLVFDEAESGPRDRQNVAVDVAHELAHQWFGNLVTMRWWDGLWLNEGFATYVEYLGVDHVEPEWNIFESFTRDKMDLLRSDALKNTSPVSRQVMDASEISQKFDEISYTKGANLIRMLNHTVSEELFHHGLLIYLDQWKYMNAEENDLWAAMSKANPALPKDLSVVEFMNTWTRQAGYPVVNVKRNYETGEVTFEQRLFTTAEEPYKKMADQLWHIPISYTSMDASLDQWSTKPKIWLSDRSTTIKLPLNASQALYVNVEAIGYYRVNYDQKNWELLNEALKTGNVKSPVVKAQLIDDAFNLAKVSQLNYSYALGLTTCVMDGEDSKIVWDLLLNNMLFLKYNLRTTSGYIYFQDYMKKLLAKQLERLNYGLNKPKDDNEAFLIENLVTWECYVESPRCLNWAKTEFEKWVDQTDHSNNPIPSYLRSLVYNMALRHGGRREFALLWDVFENSTDPAVKSLIITNLPSTRLESLITFLLEKSLDEIPKQYAVGAWSVEPPVGTQIAQTFLEANFQQVYDKFTRMDAFMFPNVLSGAYGFIADRSELDKLKRFALQHKEQLMPMSQTLQKIVDTATLRIDWLDKHARNIDNWFRDYLGNSTTKPVVVDTTPLTPSAEVTTPTPETTLNSTTLVPVASTSESNTSP